MTKVYKFLRLITYATLMVCTCLLTSCVTESVPDNNKRGNFEALWQTPVSYTHLTLPTKRIV